MKIDQPYNDADHKVITEQLRKLADVRAALQKAQVAKINCAEMPDMCDKLIELYQALAQTYFPNRAQT